jgi:hypothetical protein
MSSANRVVQIGSLACSGSGSVWYPSRSIESFTWKLHQDQDKLQIPRDQTRTTLAQGVGGGPGSRGNDIDWRINISPVRGQPERERETETERKGERDREREGDREREDIALSFHHSLARSS